MSKYFWFSFSARFHSGSSRHSPWMDERFSKAVTIEEREYLSCDKVAVNLFTPNGSICSVDDIESGRYSLQRSARLVRYGVAESEVDFDHNIIWTRLSDYGEPDTCTYVSSGGLISGVTFLWDEKWRDSYWLLNSGRDGKLRRTRFSITDIDRRTHYFYAVPWFGGEFGDG